MNINESGQEVVQRTTADKTRGAPDIFQHIPAGCETVKCRNSKQLRQQTGASESGMN